MSDLSDSEVSASSSSGDSSGSEEEDNLEIGEFQPYQQEPLDSSSEEENVAEDAGEADEDGLTAAVLAQRYEGHIH